MDSKANLSVSAQNSIKSNEAIKGYSLKKGKLKKWIYDHRQTQPNVAKKLGLPVVEFKRMLQERELFNRDQLSKLIELLGAAEAFNVIYFPSVQERRKIYREVFGKGGQG